MRVFKEEPISKLCNEEDEATYHEIARVRASLFQINGVKKEPLVLPEPEGEVTTLTEKVYVPVKEHPDFNFVGRILGPRGMTAKQLEQETGCKIMVRGKGSMRDKKKGLVKFDINSR
ncbi:putative K homology RNA-binding domain protein [Trypoxylus dichotomus]